MSFTMLKTHNAPAAMAKPVNRKPDQATKSGLKSPDEIAADQAAYFILNAGKRPYLNHSTEVKE